MNREFFKQPPNELSLRQESAELGENFKPPEREYQELQKENFEEHEKWQNNLKEVVVAMRKKRDDIQEVVRAMKQKKLGQPAAQGIRVLVVVLGGGMQGPYGAGQMCALQEMGYTSSHINERDVFLGISAGAATCAFGIAGRKQALLGTSYFYTVCTTKAFMNYMRLHQVMDVSVIGQALKNEFTKLDVEAIRRNPAQFYVQAYNENTKEPEFINTKDTSLDMTDALLASMAIPVIYNKTLVINGVKYSDGAFDDPLPVVRAIQRFRPTHILILPNTPFNRIPLGEPSKLERLLVKAIPHAGSLGFVRKVLNNRHALRQSLEAVAQNHNVKIGVAWPPEMGLGMMTQDKTKIKTAVRAAAKDFFDLFGEPERVLKLYEEEYPEDEWSQHMAA